ncbi:uncharacterized protein LOC136750781 [Amia ocellicauda]|uniref:uncharacterized protein LOC136750781 n=1 Tax=Amia ocellicauda TaxID=2972642 RepID=UPI003463929A
MNMAQDTFMNGGICILHKTENGKHHYEVENVVRYTEDKINASFVRNGDKLLMINGSNLEDLPPEAFAKLLSEGSVSLTVHQQSRTRREETSEGEMFMKPYFKEDMFLKISLEMENKNSTEEGETLSEQEGNPGEDDDCCLGEESPDCDVQNLLLVSMRRTSISVMVGRGCENLPGPPCRDCTTCTMNEVVVVSESSKVKLVSRGPCNLLQDKVQDNIIIQSIFYDHYIQKWSNIPVIRPSRNAASMTLYYYKSDVVDGEFKGTPVTLNFTSSNCFLKCSIERGKVTLRIDTCEKEKLKKISSGNPETWPFVFYMKASGENSRSFESANCPGWFIKDKGERVVVSPNTKDGHFFIVIKK